MMLCLRASLSFGQTEEETLEWLKVKKTDISEHWSMSNNVSSDAPGVTLKFESDLIKVASTNGAWTTIDWENIKDFKVDGADIKVVSGVDYSSTQKYFIRLRINDSSMREKYLKALKHMASLKGAVLLKEDLF